MAALTIQQYYDILAAEKATFASLAALQPNIDDSQTMLADLTTPSKVARWRLELWIGAFLSWVIATAYDRFVAEVDAKAATAAPGTLQWLRKQLINLFQNGYELEFVNDAPGYSTIDPAARIVIQAAVTQNANGLVTVKVAKDDGSGGLTPLSPSELLAVDAFVGMIKDAGTVHTSLSLYADLLKLLGTIIYNPLLGLPAIQTAVTAAINAYLRNLPFNGKVNINSLMDAIQAVPGVVGVVLPTFDAADAGGLYSTYGYDYQTLAGYIVEDPANTFVTTITWQAA